jgi:lysozyme
MRISDHGLALVARFEGLRLEAYRCPAGVWTIGYGHTGPEVGPGARVTAAEARALLRADLARFERAVAAAVGGALPQHRFDALVSFAFNVGEAAFRRSTVLKRVRAGRFEDVPSELMRWTRGGGRELPGLVARRRAEAKLWRGLGADAGPAGRDAGPVAAKGSDLSRSRTVAGGAAAAAGGIAVAAESVGAFTSAAERAGERAGEGSLVGLALALLIVAGAALALYARWDDAGRPLPRVLAGLAGGRP